MDNNVDLFLHGSSINDSMLTNPLNLFLQEIELSLKILPNEVWGINEALNISRYVYNKYVTVNQIKNEILTYVNKNCEHASFFNYEVNVLIINESGKDLIYIEFKIFVETNEGITEQLQKFLLGN